MTMDRTQRGIARVISKLENSLETGNYYEAHQMYRTLYFRYTSQGNYNECLELLFNGAMKLLNKGQEASAADLCLLYVETLEKCKGVSDTADWMLAITRLIKVIERLSATIVERETIICRAIKWSADVSGNTYGFPALHKYIANIFWNEGNTEQARHHYLLSQDGDLCGVMLAKLNSEKGFANEVDLFIVQAVLQELCLKDEQTAEHTFISYTKHHPLIKRAQGPFEQPLLNFIHLLFRVIEMGNLEAFNELCKLYKTSLDRDPSFEKYLTKVSVIYLGAVPPSSNGGGLMGGMFGDFFSRLFQGFDEDEDAEQQNNVESQLGGGDGFYTNELD